MVYYQIPKVQKTIKRISMLIVVFTIWIILSFAILEM